MPLACFEWETLMGTSRARALLDARRLACSRYIWCIYTSTKSFSFVCRKLSFPAANVPRRSQAPGFRSDTPNTSPEMKSLYFATLKQSTGALNSDKI